MPWGPRYPKQFTIFIADYVPRQAAAERLLARQVEAWRAEPATSLIAKAADAFAGLLGAAAAWDSVR